MRLQAIAEELLVATGSSRVTIRGPLHRGGIGTHLLAEALAPGIESMADAPQAGIAEAPTYVFLRTQRRPLLQSDTTQDPLPPAMLVERYRVGAQMLGPLLDGDALIGTVSVHEVGRARTWTAADLAALRASVDQVLQSWRGSPAGPAA